MLLLNNYHYNSQIFKRYFTDSIVSVIWCFLDDEAYCQNLHSGLMQTVERMQDVADCLNSFSWYFLLWSYKTNIHSLDIKVILTIVCVVCSSFHFWNFCYCIKMMFFFLMWFSILMFLTNLTFSIVGFSYHSHMTTWVDGFILEQNDPILAVH